MQQTNRFLKLFKQARGPLLDRGYPEVLIKNQNKNIKTIISDKSSKDVVKFITKYTPELHKLNNIF